MAESTITPAASLKLIQVGNSVGVILPKEVLDQLRVAKGDNLYLVKTPLGFQVTPYDPVFAAQMAVAEKVMKENRDVLRKLAQ